MLGSSSSNRLGLTGMGNKNGYRQESWLYRYRGVAAVAAVPVLLILTVLALMPHASSPTTGSEFSRAQPFSRTNFEVNAGGNVEERYSIVIDAGSTGSRIHVFKFLVSGGQLELQFDKFDQLKPGLSSFADDPPKGAQSLKPLLDLAVATVPKKLQASTRLMVGATAGLRLLPDGKADVILEEVRSFLRGYPFAFEAEDVKILSGVDEGAFAWLTLNYLLGRLGRGVDDTVAAIDLGGGSVQEAYAMTPEEAKAAPRPDYTTKLKGGGKTYQVYVYSYLGYGLMAARAAVLSEAEKEHPCVPKGYSGEYKYAGKTHPMLGHTSQGPSHDKCSGVVLTALKHQAECGAPQLQCTFNGAWGGSRVPSVFYISSYFWDRATDAGVIKSSETIEQQVVPKQFGELAAKACSASLEQYDSLFPAVQPDTRPYFCMDLSYVHTLLTKGFKIPEDKTVTLVKKVKYRGDKIEVAWALGAAINLADA